MANQSISKEMFTVSSLDADCSMNDALCCCTPVTCHLPFVVAAS